RVLDPIEPVLVGLLLSKQHDLRALLEAQLGNSSSAQRRNRRGAGQARSGQCVLEALSNKNRHALWRLADQDHARAVLAESFFCLRRAVLSKSALAICIDKCAVNRTRELACCWVAYQGDQRGRLTPFL